MNMTNMPFLRLLLIVAVLSLVTDRAIALENRGTAPDQEMLRLGERMYRDGKLSSGEPMQGYVKGDIPVDSTVFSCESCHMRGGLGSIEGGVTTPPTTGNKLFQPYYSGTILTTSPKSHKNHYVLTPSRRPAYTEETLANALRGGMNPVGRKLNDVMPRYHLQDKDMAILINYLKSLSAEIAPGVDNTTMRLATIITEGVSPEDRKAMLEPLESFVAMRNTQARVYAARAKYMGGGGFPEEVNLAYRKLSLSRWELKGGAETWQQQLEELTRKEPVFAFIGGMTTGEWQPVHDFCESHKIPCLFPITDYPVISATDWYTMYISKGLYQEGEAAARFLGNVDNLPSTGAVVQIVSETPAGRRLSAGFVDTWRELGNTPPVTISVTGNEPLDRNLLLQAMNDHKPAAILLWTGAEILPALEQAATGTTPPGIVFASSGYLQKEIWNLPEKVRSFTYITYPYKLSGNGTPSAGTSPAAMTGKAERSSRQRITTKVQTITEILQLGLMHLNRNFYRDNFLDVISMLPDQTPQDFDRISFGPGQRYASKGCNIVQLTEGANPVLVKKSDWVIH